MNKYTKSSLLLIFALLVNIVILFREQADTDVYQTVFSLENKPDNVRIINNNLYDIETKKQNRVFDVWTTTPTVNEIQNGNIVMFYSDDTGRLIYRVNNVVYYLQGTAIQ